MLKSFSWCFANKLRLPLQRQQLTMSRQDSPAIRSIISQQSLARQFSSLSPRQQSLWQVPAKSRIHCPFTSCQGTELRSLAIHWRKNDWLLWQTRKHSTYEDLTRISGKSCGSLRWYQPPGWPFLAFCWLGSLSPCSTAAEGNLYPTWAVQIHNPVLSHKPILVNCPY